MSKLSESKNFNSNEIFDMCKDLYSRRDSGLDCSEMVEDLMDKFQGSALLILSPNYKSLTPINFVDCNDNVIPYVYHYAYLSEEGKIFDPMLGYFNIGYSSYVDRVLEHSSTKPIIEKVCGPYLKTFI